VSPGRDAPRPAATGGEPGPIQLISASAGSGKTHRLVNELEQAITRAQDPVRPEGIIATTFTVKAAAELRERVRSRLLEKGHVEQAQRLGAARIGTVHSICAQLVTDFAFDLGISPESRGLDEAAADQAFAHALSSLVSVAREEEGRAITSSSDAGAALMELTERWPGLEWLKDVQAIAVRARENALAPEALRDCAPRSADALLGYFGPAAADGEALDRALELALGEFLAVPHDETRTTAEVVDLASQVRTRLRAGRALSWWEWSKLAAAAPGAKSRVIYEPLREAARGHERHPALRADLRRCIELVFELAAQALEAYERHKRAWGLMDFVDQEVLALQLLRRPGVQEMLREQVDLVLVDEFQDTSPLQLDIFLAFSRLAPRSVWVGDQKQAIYGFRGTDPGLMDAAIAAIVGRAGGQARETLQYSWRSRAELVRLTSDVFAPAFEVHDIPAERVRLEPAPEVAQRRDTLGAVVEGWRLNGKKKAEDAAALAAAVRELLDDPQALVRDVLTNEARRVQPRDLAILCRSGTNCGRVTSALEAIGIAAVRPRTGLMDTPEARVAMAALRLWVDPRQPLAAAELGRLFVHPGDADAWLGAVLDAPGQAYATQPEIVRIAEAGRGLPLAGPLAAFDAALEAIGARETCLRWGRPAQRLANLDALRALVHRYVATCGIEGVAATVAGLVAHFGTLGDDGQDDQATLSGEDAVTVGTLHAAKGLEWPVTVLYEIDSVWKPTAFGVHLVSDRERFDFSDPLGGRWIRYWPDPYAPFQRMPSYRGNTALHEAVRAGREHAAVTLRELRETLRLLYVGWTRARDRLVLAARPGKLIGATLGLLRDREGKALIAEPEPACTWAGRPVAARIRSTTPGVAESPVPEPGLGYDASGPRAFPPASADISRLSATGPLGEAEVLGPAPFIQLPVEWAALGSAVHAFLAADRAGPETTGRLAMATAVLERWSVQGALRADALCAAADALRAWVERRWPAAARHHEWPVRLRQEGGTELIGYADLVLMGGESFVLVDHKCVGGSREEALAAAAGYAGQLGAYAEAIAKATGKRAAGCFVHLVTQGVVVAVGVGKAVIQ
jgi:ATP-dependent exoDNAse (exonuclease V) beta subunit